MTVRQFLDQAIKASPYSKAELSRRLGKNHAYLSQFIREGLPDKLDEDDRAKLAAILGVEESALRDKGKINHQVMRPLPSLNKAANRPDIRASIVSPDQLKVLGMAEGGPDGWNLFNGDEVVQTIGRPHNLLGVTGAYAVFLRGDSMLPVYRPGWTIHIHPGKPVEPGCYVLVQRHNPDDERHPYAVIKQLVRRTADKLVLAQLNPAKQITVPTKQVISIHRVVGSSEP